MHALEEGRSPLVLTERLSQLSILEDKLSKVARNVIVLKGKMTKKERHQAKERLASIPDEEERVIISTGKYIGEGFDDHRLDTMFLCLPISSKTNIQQYAGRLHRIHSAKKSVQVYDYVDTEIPRCQKMFKKRSRRYRGLGYKLLDKKTPEAPQELEYIAEEFLD